jgi:hypothetical protein
MKQMIMKLFDKWRWEFRKRRRDAAKIEKRVKKYSSLTIKSWENIELEYQKDHRWPRAVAAVDEKGWFSVAMNCMRDGDMGFQDRDGVYERFWWADEAGDIDLHNATLEEADLYLKKVDMLDILGRPQCKRGAISVIRLDGVTYIIYPTD